MRYDLLYIEFEKRPFMNMLFLMSGTPIYKPNAVPMNMSFFWLFFLSYRSERSNFPNPCHRYHCRYQILTLSFLLKKKKKTHLFYCMINVAEELINEHSINWHCTLCKSNISSSWFYLFILVFTFGKCFLWTNKYWNTVQIESRESFFQSFHNLKL